MSSVDNWRRQHMEDFLILRAMVYQAHAIQFVGSNAITALNWVIEEVWDA